MKSDIFNGNLLDIIKELQYGEELDYPIYIETSEGIEPIEEWYTEFDNKTGESRIVFRTFSSDTKNNYN